MTYALGPDHVHVTVSYMHKKFKKNECKQGQLIIWSVGLFILTRKWAFFDRFCLKSATSGHKF